MKFSSTEIDQLSNETGFNATVIEKVMHLLNLLNVLNAHSHLKNKLALKGGTALNLFIFDMPRLSVDIDLNYIGEVDREKMLEDRPKVEQAMQAVFEREGFTVKRVPSAHAGGKWRLGYQSYIGQNENLEVDINYVYRQSLWEPVYMDSRIFGDIQAKNISVVHMNELFSGKLAALFSRTKARDLYDAHQLLTFDFDIEPDDLRIAFVVYGAMNSKDWRNISFDDILFEEKDFERMLFPVLKSELIPNHLSAKEYGKGLVDECRDRLKIVFPFTEKEKEFLEELLSEGEIRPKLLTDNVDLQERISRHPGLLWQVKKHGGNSKF